jgi:predicted small integral membrane protein
MNTPQIVDIEKEVTGFFGFTCISNLVGNAISISFIIAAIVTFIFLVVGGMNWLTSGGDKAKVETAQKMITNAIIGLAIVAASYAIYLIVLDFFGIDLSKLCTDNPVGS